MEDIDFAEESFSVQEAKSNLNVQILKRFGYRNFLDNTGQYKFKRRTMIRGTQIKHGDFTVRIGSVSHQANDPTLCII